MAGLTNYLEATFLEYVQGFALPTAPTTLYIGLNIGDDDAGGNEVTTSYLTDRGAYTSSDLTAPATVSGFRQTKNSTVITLGTTTNFGSDIPDFTIWDAITGGNCLYTGTFVDGFGVPAPISFGVGDTITIPIDGLKINLSLTSTSEYLRNIEINWLRGTTAPSPSTTYAALCTAVDPNGTVTEVTTTVQTAGRVAVTAWDAVTTSGDFSYTLNTNSINFGNSAGNVSDLSHVALFDDTIGGNLLKFAQLPLARNVAIGDPVIWQAGKYRIEQS